MTAFCLNDFCLHAGHETIDEIRELASKVKGRVIMVNSTDKGGGVAELLHSFLPLFKSMGVDMEWHVLKAPSYFFDVTKTFQRIAGRP